MSQGKCTRKIGELEEERNQERKVFAKRYRTVRIAYSCPGGCNVSPITISNTGPADQQSSTISRFSIARSTNACIGCGRSERDDAARREGVDNAVLDETWGGSGRERGVGRAERRKKTGRQRGTTVGRYIYLSIDVRAALGRYLTRLHRLPFRKSPTQRGVSFCRFKQNQRRVDYDLIDARPMSSNVPGFVDDFSESNLIFVLNTYFCIIYCTRDEEKFCTFELHFEVSLEIERD